MNTKYHVSLEVAKMLKELGYNEETSHYYNSAGKLYLGNGHFNYNAYAVNLSAPTKAEAIDWLESKGIVVMLYMYSILYEDYTIKGCWGYRILQGDELLFTDNSSNTPTRLEAEDAAIIKALELLNRKEE